MTDHSQAAAQLLAEIIEKLASGEPPEDLGKYVILIGRMMERKT